MSHSRAANTGAVPRAQLEAWLQTHCRPLLAAVDAATMLDLLLQHTYGTERVERVDSTGGTAYVYMCVVFLSF